jgi:hypothetical protein
MRVIDLKEQKLELKRHQDNRHRTSLYEKDIKPGRA